MVETQIARRTAPLPVNLLAHEARTWPAPRGHGQWVRNVRANDGRLDLLLGRRRTHHVAHELADQDKVDVLRAYLARWKFEVGQFFDGVDASSTDETLLAIAPNHPVFHLDLRRLSRRSGPLGHLARHAWMSW